MATDGSPQALGFVTAVACKCHPFRLPTVGEGRWLDRDEGPHLRRVAHGLQAVQSLANVRGLHALSARDVRRQRRDLETARRPWSALLKTRAEHAIYTCAIKRKCGKSTAMSPKSKLASTITSMCSPLEPGLCCTDFRRHLVYGKRCRS